jgi:hypothetical protein
MTKAMPAGNDEKAPGMKGLSREFSIAPMMEWTDRAEKQSLIST